MDVGLKIRDSRVGSAMRVRCNRYLSIAVTLVAAALILSATEGCAQAARIKKVEFDEASLGDLIDFLREGAAGKTRNILVDPRMKKEIRVTLTLHDVTKGVAFAYAAELGGFDYREERHAIRIVPRSPKATVKAFLKRGNPMTLRRASEIVMPKVEFDEAELRQVIDDIATASRQLDSRKKGINVLLGPGVDPSTPVTFQLQNVPVAEVLKYVADFARLDIRTDGNAVVLLKRRKVAR